MISSSSAITRKILPMVVLLTMASLCYGQQLPIFTQYREYHGLINPASLYVDYLNGTQTTCIGVSTRFQWLKVPNGPRTHLIHAERLWKQKNNAFSKTHPLTGLYIISDQAGRLATNGIYARFSVVLAEDPQYAGISLGFSGGIVRYSIRVEPDELPENSSLTDNGKVHPDLNVGVFGYRKLNDFGDKIFGGLSLVQLFQNNIRYVGSFDTLSYDRKKHIYFTSGYIKRLNELAPGAFLESQLWVRKFQNNSLILDGSLRLMFNEYFWVGGGYSTAGLLHTEIGLVRSLVRRNKKIKANRFKIGIGFDANIKGFQNFGNAYELNLSYSFGKPPIER